MSPREPLPYSALLTGELDDEAFEELLRRAEHDPEAAANLELVADLAAVLEKERPPLSMTEPPRSARPGRLGLWLASAVAAGLVATLALLSRIDEADPVAGSAAELAAGAPPTYVDGGLRGFAHPKRRAFAEAMRPYTAGDFEAAELSLGDFLAEHPEHAAARFYRAASLAALGRLERAADEYRAVIAAQAGYVAVRARWQLVQVLLLQENVGEARVHLRALQTDEGAFHVNATALLERLER